MIRHKTPDSRLQTQGARLKLCGFTLVEILLVVVLIALLAGASGGMYAGTYKRALVRKSARDFFLTVKYARMLAIERQSECRLEIDTKGGKFQLTYNVSNPKTRESEHVVVRNEYCRPATFDERVKFEVVRIGRMGMDEVVEVSAITFSPNGTAQEAIVQIGDGKSHYTVSVTAATGKVKIGFCKAEDVKTNSIDLDQQEFNR